jgi:peptide deformylase
MTVLKLVTYPSPSLNVPAKPVDKITSDINKLLDDMFETMYAANGIGLAAPQVGVSLRIAVLDVGQAEGDVTPGFINSGKFELINPVITKREGEIEWEEGCLSVPDFWMVMKRSKKITISYLNREGDKKTLNAEGLLAIAIQQELDHLDGKLIIDSASRLKRGMYDDKIRKESKKKTKQK